MDNESQCAVVMLYRLQVISFGHPNLTCEHGCRISYVARMRDSNIWHRCLSTNPVCICHYSKILLRSFQQFTGADIAAMSIHAGNC
ncbi:hypothetical protein M758_2G199000 [Ceratodon purpureus]|nr:hypothetical protein M758_2G199000 [Ceratodon purpureus]